MSLDFSDPLSTEKLINDLPYRSGLAGAKDGQLALRLGQIDTVPIDRNAPFKSAKFSSPGRQLKLSFTDLPEAVSPKNIKVARPVTELLQIADDVPLADLPPSIRGEVINNMEGQVRARLSENQLRMSVEPDVGRRPILSSERVPVPTYVPSDLARGLPVTDLPVEQLLHGTRVENLNLSAADPVAGSALSELGSGLYFSTSRDVAEMATKAANSEGLPNVAGRVFMPEGSGAIHTTFVNPSARIMDATTPSPALERIVESVAKHFPGLAERPRNDTRSYVQIISDMVELEDSAAARLQFQQELVKALRAEGIDGARGADNVAIFNPAVVETTGVEKVTNLGLSADDAYDARSALEDWGMEQNFSNLSSANALDAETIALNQRLNQLNADKRAAALETWKDIKYEGLMDHPTRVPTLDEYSRLVVDDMLSFNASPSTYKPDPILSAEIGDNVIAAVKRRGVNMRNGALGIQTRGAFNPITNEIKLNTALGVDDLTKVENLKTLIHEMGHKDIDKVVEYAGKGVTNNEAIVDSVASAVLSILDPSLGTNRKRGFDAFFDYLTDATSSYAKDYNAGPVSLRDLRKNYGELIVKMVKDTVEEIAPKGFKTPAINELRIFGPESYESFAANRYGTVTSLQRAFDGSLTSIDDGLTVASKIDILATNPASGKLNTKVRNMLYDTFADDVLLKVADVSPADDLARKWADGIARSGAANPARAKKAQAVLDLIQRGEGSTEEYIEVLTKLDKPGSKQYVPAIRKGMDDVQVRKYC